MRNVFHTVQVVILFKLLINQNNMERKVSVNLAINPAYSVLVQIIINVQNVFKINTY